MLVRWGGGGRTDILHWITNKQSTVPSNMYSKVQFRRTASESTGSSHPHQIDERSPANQRPVGFLVVSRLLIRWVFVKEVSDESDIDKSV